MPAGLSHGTNSIENVMLHAGFFDKLRVHFTSLIKVTKRLTESSKCQKVTMRSYFGGVGADAERLISLLLDARESPGGSNV